MSDNKYIYCAVQNQCEWEDIIIFTEEIEAVEYSKEHQHVRLEIFIQTAESKGYVPTYNYYKNGVLYMT
jgi:hypothetical protein